MGPHEEFPSAPAGLHTIYNCFTYFYFEFDDVQSEILECMLMSVAYIYLEVIIFP